MVLKTIMIIIIKLRMMMTIAIKIRIVSMVVIRIMMKNRPRIKHFNLFPLIFIVTV